MIKGISKKSFCEYELFILNSNINKGEELFSNKVKNKMIINIFMFGLFMVE